MKFEDMVRNYFSEQADNILKDFPKEDPDISKMTLEELKIYTQE